MRGPAASDWRYSIEPGLNTASSAGREERAAEQRRREDVADRPVHASGASRFDTEVA